MNNFIFKNPTKLIFGKDTIPCLGAEIPAGAKIMMTYGGGSIRKNGVYDQVKAALQHHTVIEFGGIEANPEYETLMKAVRIARDEKVDFLLAVGGGSVIDGTKFISAAIPFTGEPWDILVKKAEIVDSVPFGTVLTLPATGSEMNNGAVISRRQLKEKFAFNHKNGFPQFSVLDPQTCYSLPKRQIANGIIDSFIHVGEQYMTYPSQAMVMDRFSEGVLSTLIELGPRLMENSQDYDAMSNFMLAATMALNGFLSMGVPQDWATHMIGHELTALHGLDHGVTLAIVYPSLLRVMKQQKSGKLLQYAERVWGITTGSDDEKMEEAIARTESFFNSLGVATTLGNYEIEQATIDEIVDRFNARKIALGEKMEITPGKVREILEMAL